jgi:hypothetical protein
LRAGESVAFAESALLRGGAGRSTGGGTASDAAALFSASAGVFLSGDVSPSIFFSLSTSFDRGWNLVFVDIVDIDEGVPAALGAAGAAFADRTGGRGTAERARTGVVTS